MSLTSRLLDAQALQDLVERYFAAVDRKDVTATLACFGPQALFGIANHGVSYQGRDTELRGMFERLHERYARVWHGDFDHVLDVPRQRAASRFRVENTTHAGELLHKNNCNFFLVQDGLFAQVWVYMSGDNSLR
ncbi:MAG: nuclear transport factor 2 family protein [Betaproteobacteria bacterium]